MHGCVAAYGRAPCVKRAVFRPKICMSVSRSEATSVTEQQHQSGVPTCVQEQQHAVQQYVLPPVQQQRQQAASKARLPQLPAPLQQGLEALLQPAKRVVSAVNQIDPRVRGLLLLNCMTLLMGSNWVVVKDSNDAFDPVRVSFALWLLWLLTANELLGV